MVKVLQQKGDYQIPDKYKEITSLVKQRYAEPVDIERLLHFAESLEPVEPTENALKVAESRYFRRDENGAVVEDWRGMISRVARDIAWQDGDVNEKLALVFQKVMEAGLFFPNSPTMMNAGTPVQQLQACFVLPIEDSMESIFETLKDSALIQKSGGGVGYFIGKIRQKGAIVSSTGGQASGPISFLSIYNKVSNEIRQGGRRRGASLATLQYDHPDIMEFIDSKRQGGELSNFNISVRVDDTFMRAVEQDLEYDLLDSRDGTPIGQKLKAREVFNRIAENAHLNGEPGLLFFDAINKENPTPHLGDIEATNPCITGDMLVSTENGLETMERLCGKSRIRVLTDDRVLAMEGEMLHKAEGINVLGRTPPEAYSRNSTTLRPVNRFFKQGEKPVYRLKTRSGYTLKATGDHRILTASGWKPVQELLEGEGVFIQSGRGTFNRDDILPVTVNNRIKGKNGRIYCFNLPHQWSARLGEVLGWLVGDGWLRTAPGDERVGFCFGRAVQPVFSYLKPILDEYYGKPLKEVRGKNGCIHLSYHSKFFVDFFVSLGVIPAAASEKRVPWSVLTATEAAVKGFLRGLFSADGTARFAQGKSAYGRLTSKSELLLQQVQLLLLNLGIKSTLYRRYRKPRNVFEYTSIEGKTRAYISDGKLFELQVSRDSLPLFLQEIGFLGSKHEGTIKQFNKQAFCADRFVDEVKEVEFLGIEKVYDLQEPVTRSFIANGMVVHNCGEQPLLPYESCNLGSINLARLVKKEGGSYVPDWEKIRLVTHAATLFLDRVLDRNMSPVEAIEITMKGNRKIGLGIMGLAQYLIWQGITYNSEEGFQAAEDVMREITVQSKVASWQLAEEHGPFSNFAGSIWDRLDLPQRNATTTTIAPTGSLSIFANASPSAEPLFGVGFARNIMDDRFVQIDSVFELMWQAHMNTDLPEALKDTIGEKGPHGIQDIAEIPLSLRRLFLCAHDISPLDHIRMQTIMQKWVDNAVSKTINAPNEATLEDCRNAFFEAWRRGAKGITYYRDGSRESQVITSTAEKTRTEHPTTPGERGAVPRERPETTFGQTTRKQIGFCGRLYVTVNKEITEDGQEQICEVFTSVGEEGCPPLSNALAKIISISVRAGVDIHEIVEKLREEKCPSCIMHPETTVLSCTDFIGQELAKAATGKIGFKLNAAGGPKNIRMCSSCKIGYMIPDALCSYCDYCGYTTCG